MAASRNLPPLSSVRSFEAAARHRSFTLAAEELAVTQGAVSLQVRKLESFLGKKLFVRQSRKVELTQAGVQYYEACRRLLADLEDATSRLLSRDRGEILIVNTLPTIGQLWLMPRLADFTAAHRHIEVRVVSDIRPLDMQADGVDVALRVGPLAGRRYPRHLPGIDLTLVQRWDGICADYLFDDVLVPVMSRRLLEQGGPIGSLDELLAFPLIHTASRPHAWRDWLNALGAALPPQRNCPDYGHFYIALRAAQEHKGIALIPEVLIDGYPGRNELVVPWRPEHPPKSAGEYYLLTHGAWAERAAITAFRGWVLREAAASIAANAAASEADDGGPDASISPAHAKAQNESFAGAARLP
ncbi:LysR family transcriptional regulator [Bordetella ansorpii]|uniref:LysR family transcriptional regulator n=1 Tax=Bordetella ansorpii TaxID=288768 RepID=A0A157SQ48_9BORD|nr:LysR substrate-binding domain-containing protein [Bordetella ansorpii]SAI72283.1 LysR family transcriptional regulator [Bordetella ansorpii]